MPARLIVLRARFAHWQRPPLLEFSRQLRGFTQQP
jgi:hypothetical protein